MNSIQRITGLKKVHQNKRNYSAAASQFKKKEDY